MKAEDRQVQVISFDGKNILNIIVVKGTAFTVHELVPGVSSSLKDFDEVYNDNLEVKR